MARGFVEPNQGATAILARRERQPTPEPGPGCSAGPAATATNLPHTPNGSIRRVSPVDMGAKLLLLVLGGPHGMALREAVHGGTSSTQTTFPVKSGQDRTSGSPWRMWRLPSLTCGDSAQGAAEAQVSDFHEHPTRSR